MRQQRWQAGVCLTRCQLDADCTHGDLCLELDFGCACGPPVDGGTLGSCPQG